MKQFDKIDSNTIRITDIPTSTQVVSTYVYEDLILNRDNLLAGKNSYNTMIDLQIAEAEKIIKAADDLGIKAK